MFPRISLPQVFFLSWILSAATALAEDATSRTEYAPPSGAVDAEGRKHGDWTEVFPDGTLKSRVRYQNGKRHGKLTKWDEAGKIRMQVDYLEDRPHGWLREIEEGKIIRDQFLLEGKIFIPKSIPLLKQEFAEIRRLEIPLVGEDDSNLSYVAEKLEDAKFRREMEAATRRILQYRACCHLAFHDFAIDRGRCGRALAGVKILDLRHEQGIRPPLTHTPENPGLPEAEFRLGYEGTSRSNLFWSEGGHTLSQAIDYYMDDSDPSNIDRVAHRRWLLDPQLHLLGFGRGKVSSTTFVVDRRSWEKSTFDFVAFPPPGYLPISFLEPHVAWSVSVNPGRFRTPPEDVRIVVREARLDLLKRQIQPGTELALDFRCFDSNPIAIPNCLIFRPKPIRVAPGSSYLVEIEGLEYRDGSPASLRYVVLFAKL